jgi:hypothetical protein
MGRSTLLRVDNPGTAEASITEVGGRVVMRLSEHLLVADLPPTTDLTLSGAQAVAEEDLSALPPDDRPLAQAWFESQRVLDRPESERPLHGLPWDAEGFQPP